MSISLDFNAQSNQMKLQMKYFLNTLKKIKSSFQLFFQYYFSKRMIMFHKITKKCVNGGYF